MASGRRMERSALTQKMLKAILTYDPVTGIFTRRISRNGYVAGSVAGCIDGDGYVVVSIGKRRFYAHRLAWLYVYGVMPVGDLDHRDLNRSNNPIANLREATRAQNMANTLKRANNRSGFKGVSFHRHSGLYRATLFVGGKQLCGKYHRTPQAAHAEYCEMAVKSYGEFARVA